MRILRRTLSLNWLSASRQVEFRRLTRLLDLKMDDSLLDVGCGDGYWSRRWATRCGALVGLDSNGSRIAEARSRTSPSARFFQGEATALPFDDCSFSKTVSMCVFEHISDDQAAFAEVFRVLKPNGLFGLSVDSLGVAHRTPVEEAHRLRFSVCRYYDVEMLRSRLLAAGFTRIDVEEILPSSLSVALLRLRLAQPRLATLLSPITGPIELAANRFRLGGGEGLKLCARGFKPAETG